MTRRDQQPGGASPPESERMPPLSHPPGAVVRHVPGPRGLIRSTVTSISKVDTRLLSLSPAFLDAIRRLDPKRRRAKVRWVLLVAVLGVAVALAIDATTREFIVTQTKSALTRGQRIASRYRPGSRAEAAPASAAPPAPAHVITASTAEIEAEPAGASTSAPALLAWMNIPVEAAEFLVTGENRQVADGSTVWTFFDAKGADLRIDRNGHPVRAPAAKAEPKQPKDFARSRPYSGSFAAVNVGGDCGYVDESGIVKPLRLRACGDFHDNLAKVVTLAGNATYISAGLTPIHAGMPSTEDSPGLWFRDGLAPMQDAATKLWGYIDAQGKWSIAPQFQVAGSFSEGLAPVEELDSHDRLRLGFIDRTGKLVIPYKFGSQSVTNHWIQFSEGRAIVTDLARFPSKAKTKTGTTVEDPRRAWYGVIDTAGRWISPLRFRSCGVCVFLDGRAQAFGPGQKLIDRAGRVVWNAK